MRNESPFVVATLTFLVFAVAILLVRFWPTFPENFQSYICEDKSCNLQAWLSALSGYFAIVAAGIGVWFTFGQLTAARRQTSFIVGDASPTIAMLQTSSNSHAASFAVHNWNRRTMVVFGARIASDHVEDACPRPSELRYLPEHEKGKRRVWGHLPLNADGELEIGRGLRGWTNRQEPPPSWVLEFHFPEDAFEGYSLTSKQPLRVELHYGMEDDVGMPRLRTIFCFVAISQIAPK